MKNSFNSKKLPSFSILMANYNNANYISEAIESVLNQSYPNWELIIVDDVSSDDSINKIRPFLEDKRIRLVSHKKNMGYGGSLRTAANNSSNDILVVFDSDDKLHEKALELISQAYKQYPDCGFIYSTYWECDSNLENPKLAEWVGPVTFNKTNLHWIRIGHLKTFKREVYLMTEGFSPHQKRAVDKDIIFKLEEKTKLKFINEPLYYYRKHFEGISQGKNNFEARVYYYLAKLKAYRRRLNSDIPNLTKREIYFDYFKVLTFKLIIFSSYFYRLFRVNLVLEKILKLDIFPEKIKAILSKVEKNLKFSSY